MIYNADFICFDCAFNVRGQIPQRLVHILFLHCIDKFIVQYGVFRATRNEGTGLEDAELNLRKNIVV